MTKKRAAGGQIMARFGTNSGGVDVIGLLAFSYFPSAAY